MEAIKRRGARGVRNELRFCEGAKGWVVCYCRGGEGG